LTYSPEPTAPEYAYVIINATSRKFIDRIIPDLDAFCLESFPDLKATNAGAASAQAVLEASVRRLRPILLTTTTTVVGLVPPWLGGGPMFSPMAIAILFGLLFATFLTLGVVPLLYSLALRVSFRGVAANP
jgi:hypothetical protein